MRQLINIVLDYARINARNRIRESRLCQIRCTSFVRGNCDFHYDPTFDILDSIVDLSLIEIAGRDRQLFGDSFGNKLRDEGMKRFLKF